MSRFIGNHPVAAAASKGVWVYAIPSCPRRDVDMMTCPRCGSIRALLCSPSPELIKKVVAMLSVAHIFSRRSLVLVDWRLAPSFPAQS